MASLLETLPLDAWPAIARCLTGVDLVDLARANTWTWHLFSQDEYWRDRLASDDLSLDQVAEDGVPVTALQQYMRAYSFQFQGLYTSKSTDASPRGSCAQVPEYYENFVQQRGPFAFDISFCLLDGDSGAVHTGGILLGAQSAAYEYASQWPHFHQQFAIVSSDRKLYCSVLNEWSEIAGDIELNRWYHLALTHSNETQRVYLDGELKSTLTGGLHSEWWNLRYAQAGTGCITANEMNFPEPQSCGWYPFNGLINEFRMWKRELSAQDVQALARGSAGLVQGPPHYSLRASVLFYPPQNTTRIGCSRPKEKIVKLLSRRSKRDGASRRSSASRADRDMWLQSRRAGRR